MSLPFASEWQERTSSNEEGREFRFTNLAWAAIVFPVVRQFGLHREKNSMSKDAQKQVVLTDEAKKKLEDCVVALAACGFGAEGPPIDTTFAEIEEFGHEVGRMLARGVDEQLTTQHASHFHGMAACPLL